MSAVSQLGKGCEPLPPDRQEHLIDSRLGIPVKCHEKEAGRDVA